MLSLSIIICTKDRPKQLQRCLESIFNQTLLPKELVIVDASSTNLTRNLIDSFRKTNPKMNFRYAHTRPSTAYQRNLGFDMADGDIIGSVDDDTVLAPNALKIILEVFSRPEYHDVGGAMPRLLNPPENEKPWWAASTLYKLIFMLSHNHAKRTYIQASGFPAFPFGRNDISEPQEAEVLNGLYFYRRKVAKSFKFYEGFHGYSFMEDAEFSYRVSKSYRLLYIPAAEILHLHVDVSRSSYFELFRQVVENRYYFFTQALERSFRNRLAFYWSHIGLLISALQKRPAFGRHGSLCGFIAGFRSVLSKQRSVI